MTDYYDDFSFQEVAPEDMQMHQFMLVARFLQENAMLPPEFNSQQLAPPASREVVANLPEMKPTVKDDNCTICLKPNAENDADVVFKVLPCKHAFHSGCILPWLAKVFWIILNRKSFTQNQSIAQCRRTRAPCVAWN